MTDTGIDLANQPALVHRRIEASDGVQLHCVELGTGPLVVLLHGFPDFWFAWRKQIPALAAAGFRVLAPDLRGYALSDKPPSIGDYAVRKLAADVAALVERSGVSSARVVGHDWGAGVAWAVAMAHPEKVDRIATINGPHPERMLASMRQPRQLAKLWYVFFLQLPWLPQIWLGANDFQALRRAIGDSPSGEAMPRDVVERYREAWSEPGALTAMVHWYRAMMRPGTAVPVRRVDVPSLTLWGTADPYLMPAMATPNPALVPDARVVLVEGAGHWAHLDQPERVNRELVTFFRS